MDRRDLPCNGGCQECHGGQTVRWKPSGPDRPETINASWDINDPSGAELLGIALQPAMNTSDDVLDEVWSVKNILVHSARIIGETPEEDTDILRLVLIGPGLETLSLISTHAITSTKGLLKRYGAFPWAEGKPIRVVRSKSLRHPHIIRLEPRE